MLFFQGLGSYCDFPGGVKTPCTPLIYVSLLCASLSTKVISSLYEAGFNPFNEDVCTIGQYVIVLSEVYLMFCVILVFMIMMMGYVGE